MPKSYDELMDEKAQRDQQLQEKQERYFLQRKKMNIILSVVSGVAALLLYLALMAVDLVGGTFICSMLPCAFVSGYLTGKLNIGPGPSILVFGLIHIIILVVLYGSGVHGGSFFMVLMPILFFSISGGLIGLWNSIFDNEHSQV